MDWKTPPMIRLSIRRQIIDLFFEIVAYRPVRPQDELKGRACHESGSTPVFSLNAPTSFYPVMSDVFRPMVRMASGALLPWQYVVVM